MLGEEQQSRAAAAAGCALIHDAQSKSRQTKSAFNTARAPNSSHSSWLEQTTAVRRASWDEQSTLLIEILMVHGAEDLYDTMMIVDSFKTFGAV